MRGFSVQLLEHQEKKELNIFSVLLIDSYFDNKSKVLLCNAADGRLRKPHKAKA
jgi:hypothetical protein